MDAAHAASGARVTLALVPNRESQRYGGVRLDAAGRVVGFTKRGPSAEGSFHYVGVQLADAAVFDAVPPGEPARSIGGIYDSLLSAHPGSIRGFVGDAPFHDVGTAADYWRTSQALAEAAGADASPAVGRHARIDPTARVTRSILWDDVEVGAGALVDECIVTDGVVVPGGREYRRQILLRAADAVEPRTENLEL
jgi:mannose-1-phosphate guanylyltransferase